MEGIYVPPKYWLCCITKVRTLLSEYILIYLFITAWAGAWAVYIASNSRLNSELERMWKECGLIWGTILAFSWKYWGNPWKISIRIANIHLRLKLGTTQIQKRNANHLTIVFAEDVMPCTLVDVCRCVRGMFCFHLQKDDTHIIVSSVGWVWANMSFHVLYITAFYLT
jgi:hypothetical protein